MYELAAFEVKCRHQLSIEFDTAEGVFHGEILSPILFILFIHDIVKFFRARVCVKGIRINTLDDFLMLV